MKEKREIHDHRIHMVITSYYYVLPKVTKTKARKICTTLHLRTSSFFILFFFFFR